MCSSDWHPLCHTTAQSVFLTNDPIDSFSTRVIKNRVNARLPLDNEVSKTEGGGGWRWMVFGKLIYLWGYDASLVFTHVLSKCLKMPTLCSTVG